MTSRGARNAPRARWRCVVAISLLLCLAAVSSAPASAGAEIVGGHAVVMPTQGMPVGVPGAEGNAAGSTPLGAAGPLAATAGPADIAACNPVPPAAEGSCNLTYHNGATMRTNRTHLVFWAPSGYSFPAGYQALLERYLTDVGHDSGDPTFTDSVTTQYFDTEGGGEHHIENNSNYAGAFTDTNGFPAETSTCASLKGAATTCLTEKQEFEQLDSFINSEGGPRGTGDLWFIVLPPNVQTCFTNYTWCGPYGAGESGNEYCAYHNSFTGGFGGSTPTVWANMVYAPADGCPNQEPNSNSADITVDVMSHEMNESITNPTGGGWFDDNTENGGEIGDQCNFVYGASIGSTSSGEYDELINGHPYRVQQEWSNAITGCAMNFGAVAPTASFTFSPPSPKALETVTFDGTGSKSNNAGGSIVEYSWEFGDGGTATGATPTHVYATPGTYSVTLTVKDSAGLTASTSENVVVVSRPTTTTYSGPTSGDYNDPVTLSATLVDSGSSAALEGKTLTFTLGAESCEAKTDEHGNASCSVTPLDTPGTHVVEVGFAGDAVYAASSDSKPFTVRQEESKLTYTGALTSDYHDAFTPAARLTDPDGGAPIEGKEVKFMLGVGDSCTGITDEHGNVSCGITPHQAGTQPIVAEFVGDADYLPSNDNRSFAINPEESSLSYTGPTVILASASGATLSAKMLEDASADKDGDGGSPAPVPAQTVTLAIGAQSCPATTDSAGGATCTIPSVTVPLGPETVSATFGGNAFYTASSDSRTATVFAFPSHGAFVLGDKTVAAASASTTVSWWDADWWLDNRLSGGFPPPAFKGFAATVTLPSTTPPVACSAPWVTRPGFSAIPPDTVPSYMGVLVSSSVSQHGFTISGDTTHIVVVKVKPGYGDDLLPWHRGTGTVVATYC